MAPTAAQSNRVSSTAAKIPSTNQIIRDSYLYLHWNGILTHDRAEHEMATFADAALIEPNERWTRRKAG
ncbi:hypothetical protein [Martelella radicis]|uniref:Uncharacterized protein n=1 Tax=Martelella radicis TaxID=1397476 RepID=A0A7W6KH97_9HYPH|nr:hypothetical protein [Martelella radicis]MBB4121067.1 hypothetical protein [Martelella radicis]